VNKDEWPKLSWIDLCWAKRERKIESARERLKAPSPRSSAVNYYARQIVETSKTLKFEADGNLTYKAFVELICSESYRKIANWLLETAYTEPRLLRNLDKAICNARRNDGVDLKIDRSIAWELVTAYEQCTAVLPTLPEVRAIFITRKRKKSTTSAGTVIFMPGAYWTR